MSSSFLTREITSLWSFLAFFKRARFSLSLASALTIEFFSVVVGEDGRWKGRGGVAIEETAASGRQYYIILDGKESSYLDRYRVPEES